MRIYIKKLSPKYVDITIVDGQTTIDLGVHDQHETSALIDTLKDATSQLYNAFPDMALQENDE